MTPRGFLVGSDISYIFAVDSSGYIYSGSPVSNTYGVRPVINLSADIQLTGNGTTESPYTIVES